ncbi:hypothetical protein Cs7R123_47130 [Catellatospora sp. TT07R-123]|uniref:hypothetical protein n=1 Tax=Catellatospora sp. TT07R-123 TaxID=2733863 RepID=UPI001B267532|nr:hypothetical protein [Catellatospora sp. TT07R-123]GHJ47371.1 hypothetical protein Cs7R123_47130 [Catellatospora sp. TT07R-123]
MTTTLVRQNRQNILNRRDDFLPNENVDPWCGRRVQGCLPAALTGDERPGARLVVGDLFGSNLFNSLAGGAFIGFATGSGAVLLAHTCLPCRCR